MIAHHIRTGAGLPGRKTASALGDIPSLLPAIQSKAQMIRSSSPPGDAAPFTVSIRWRLGFMKSMEKIDTFYYNYTLNALGQPTDSVKTKAGWVRRPSDRLFTFGLFLQDYLATNKNLKAFLNFLYGSNLPFNIPGNLFIVMASDIANLNLRYIRRKPLSFQPSEEEREVLTRLLDRLKEGT